MDKTLIPFRKYYFIFLNGGLIYFGLAFIIVGKAKNNLNFTLIDTTLLTLSSFIPAGLFLLRFLKKSIFWEINIYKKLLIIAHIPLFLGFVLTIVKLNYYYLISTFPIYLLNFFVLIPVKKS